MKLPRKQILIISLIIVVMAGLIFWFIRHEPKAINKILIAAALSIGLLIFMVVRSIKNSRQISKGQKVEDEFTKMARLYAGAKAFMLSMYYWLLIFWFNSSFSDREEMLGIGILGSGAIYGICYWYYRSTGNFGNEKQD